MWGFLSGEIHFLKGSSVHEQLALFLKNEFGTVSHGRWGVLSAWNSVFNYCCAGTKTLRWGGISSQSGWQQIEFLPWSHMHLLSLWTETPVGLLSLTGSTECGVNLTNRASQMVLRLRRPLCCQTPFLTQNSRSKWQPSPHCVKFPSTCSVAGRPDKGQDTRRNVGYT